MTTTLRERREDGYKLQKRTTTSFEGVITLLTDLTTQLRQKNQISTLYVKVPHMYWVALQTHQTWQRNTDSNTSMRGPGRETKITKQRRFLVILFWVSCYVLFSLGDGSTPTSPHPKTSKFANRLHVFHLCLLRRVGPWGSLGMSCFR